MLKEIYLFECWYTQKQLAELIPLKGLEFLFRQWVGTHYHNSTHNHSLPVAWLHQTNSLVCISLKIKIR